MTQIGVYIDSFISFINDVLVPLVFALAFIVFLFGVFRFFIAGATDPKKQSEGKQLIVYSLVGFAVMVSVWGLVNIITGTFNIDSTMPPVPTFTNGTTNTSNTSNCLSGTNCAKTNTNTTGTTQTQGTAPSSIYPVRGYSGQAGP